MGRPQDGLPQHPYRDRPVRGGRPFVLGVPATEVGQTHAEALALLSGQRVLLAGGIPLPTRRGNERGEHNHRDRQQQQGKAMAAHRTGSAQCA